MSKNDGLYQKIIFGTILVFAFCLFGCGLTIYAQTEFTYDSKGKRNPFIPLVTPEGKLVKLDSEEREASGMALEGIIYDKNGISYAILNGAVVKVGDMVNDSQVLKIEKNKVLLIKNGEISEVKLQGGEE